MEESPNTSRTERRCARMQEVLSRRQDDLTLVLANIHDPHNVSAIYRSCDAFGVSRVYLYYTTTAFPTLHRKTSASARKWVGTRRVDNAKDLRQSLKEQGMQILVTGFSGDAHSLWDIDFTMPCAVILGNEHSGVDQELAGMADGELYIPMQGMIQSLNVSVAAAVILAEASRQRSLAGMYAQSRLPPEEFTERLAQWLAK